jgi:CheY-like chemotaxis protein
VVGRPNTVLVIDDDPQACELMRRFLENRGFHIETAAGGPQALEMVKRIRPEVITLDVVLPGIDGWGVLAALKADAETASIPIILVTILDDRTRGYALGAADYLTKPIDGERLCRTVQKHQHASPGSVLVIDDDPDFREICRRTLASAGWLIVEAEDGRAGLARLEEQRPAVILLDLIMPGLDGFEFIEELKKHPDWRHVPVLVLTAKDLTPEDGRRLNGSVARVLEKRNFSPNALLREIHERVQQHLSQVDPSGKEQIHG